MNSSKQYSVRDWVKNSAADRAAVEAIMREHQYWSKKHARDLLARRRFTAAIGAAAKS